jgi:hypothetical protein
MEPKKGQNEVSQDYTLQELNLLIVRVKAAAFVGDRLKSHSHRPGSHDLEYNELDYH